MRQVFKLMCFATTIVLASAVIDVPRSFAAERREIIVLAPKHKVGGISSVTVHFEGGHILDPENACGASHLLEHVLGRRLYAAFHNDSYDFGFEIGGITGVDQMNVTVSAGGGEAGLIAIMENLQSALHDHEIKTFDEQERKVIALEAELAPSIPYPLRLLTQKLSRKDKERYFGLCGSSIKASPFPHKPRVVGITVGSELDEETARRVVSKRRIQIENSNSANVSDFWANQAAASFDTETSYFFVPLNPTHNPSELATFQASLGFWTQIDANDVLNDGAVRLTPFGQQGYFVHIVKPTSLSRIRREAKIAVRESRIDPTTWPDAGKRKLCTQISSFNSNPISFTTRVATNVWVRWAASSIGCQTVKSATGSARWIEGIESGKLLRPLVPIPVETIDTSKVPDAIGSNVQKIKLCEGVSNLNPEQRTYLEQVGLKYLLGVYRFKHAVALNGYVNRNSKSSCIEFDLIVTSKEDFNRANLTEMKAVQTLTKDWKIAHNAICLSWTLSRRRARDDVACTSVPTNSSYEFAKTHFGAAHRHD